jgi:predicted ATP-dependent endonuclease of OLD family
MRYLKFQIRNFKGIKDTEIDLQTSTGANVFSLVGLNESGKTTILEAIHSFSPDYRTRSLRRDQSKNDAEAAKERLPRHLLARFTGDITVEATVSISDEEKLEIADTIETDTEIRVDPAQIPNTFKLCRSDVFDRGDYVKTTKMFNFDLKGKRKKERKERDIGGDDYENVYSAIWNHTPDIAYHDSFIFDFPKRIYLTSRSGSNDWVYRKMFEDVLAAGRIPYDLDDISRRIRNDKYKKTWLDFFPLWSENDDKNRVQQIIDQASETITEVVFGKWNKIFGEEVGDKEIAVQYGVEKGRLYQRETKTYTDTNEHDLYVSLEIKHGTRRFPIQDRSLGFRWFFAFLLFTQFRTKRSEDRPVLFLFDEPAANLHSAAQERLIESFPEIATGDNMLLYSTHSHYMISPDWLEQTFIVTNAADAPEKSVVDSAVIEDESLDVKAQLYRSFANEHPSETSYFQPIIDRIEVQPSKFDISLPSIIVEGKSDFYILRYVSLLFGIKDLRLIPATGSGTFNSLVALGATWGTKFLFLLDSDNSGLKERERYALDRGARTEAITCLGDFIEGLKEIEDSLDDEALKVISEKLEVKNPSKKGIMRFFQEQLAKRNIVPLGKGFESRFRVILEGLQEKLRNL